MSLEQTSDRRLTIAHFMPWAGIGGVEIAVLRMVAATQNDFHHIAFCLPDANVLKAAFAEMGVPTVEYEPPTPSLRHIARFLGESRALAGKIRASNANIVHFSEIKAAEDCSLAARWARTRILCHVRNTYPDVTWRKQAALSLVDRFIFVSQEAKRQFGMKLPENEKCVIYDAIEIPDIDVAAIRTAMRRELGIELDRPVVGMVARVNPQKDYFTLAAAAAEVLQQRPDTVFLVVGDNALVELNRQHYQKLDKTLRELGIERSFIFTGHRKDVPNLIAAMDISILSTHREGFGLCIAESMALEKPVVATGVGGLLEVVEHGKTGLLHDHQNSHQLAEAILLLIQDTQQSQQLARAGLEHVRRSFSREQFVTEIAQTYREIAG
ncbi:MAG TPA: glycosyltransferase [Acidobacteriaceae bacterium]|nr:glycosyltransferase [Acidobacteriaceae bacterium]